MCTDERFLWFPPLLPALLLTGLPSPLFRFHKVQQNCAHEEKKSFVIGQEERLVIKTTHPEAEGIICMSCQKLCEGVQSSNILREPFKNYLADFVR